ncbi:MAG TPA: hypothetical protein VNA30_03390, partial [Mycobacteriales bacterium]|nr:hypothetical protein [Mycobacteriales bacterium]
MTAPLVTAPMVTALRADRLLPGDGAPMVSPAMLLVADGRIMDIDGTGAAAPAGAEVVDLGDITLLPGLVDAHTHLCFDSSSEVLPPLLNDTD